MKHGRSNSSPLRSETFNRLRTPSHERGTPSHGELERALTSKPQRYQKSLVLQAKANYKRVDLQATSILKELGTPSLKPNPFLFMFLSGIQSHSEIQILGTPSHGEISNSEFKSQNEKRRMNSSPI
jgi:hypothetical protein